MKRERIFFFILIILGLTPLIWFFGRPGVLINGSDTNFPLNPTVWFLRRFFVWNNIANAGANFSSSIAGIFFHLIQVIPFSLGLNLQTTEAISLVFWFSAIVFSSYIFSEILLGKNYPERLVLVAVYTFNTYIFNTWENVKVANLALVASLPLVVWLFWSYLEERISIYRVLIYSCLIGILASGSGINPAYFVTLVSGLFLAFVVKLIFSNNKKSFLRVVISFFAVLAPIILINFFWILPTISFLFFSDKGIRSINDIGFTNWLDSLSENTGVFNVLRFQGAWDWYAKDDAGAPLYIPYAPNYLSKFPFIAFSSFLTGLSFLSLVFREKKIDDKYVYFAVLLMVGVFLGIGSHDPTGELYKFLSDKLPFFSFFRSPWYIFTPLVILSISSLIGLFFMELRKIVSRKVLIILSTIFICLNLVYTYPLVTGKIFRPASADNFLIKFPSYVYDAGNWISGNAEGRVIGYPDDEIERFTWGYTGIESILNLISPAETVFSSLSQGNTEFNLIVKEFYTALKKDQSESAFRLAGKINVDRIFNKEDQKTLAPSLPKEVLALPSSSFGKWSFLEIQKDNYNKKVYSSNSLIYSYPVEDTPSNLIVVGRDALLVNPKDSAVAQIADVKSLAGAVVGSINSQDIEAKLYLSSSSKLLNSLNARDLSSVSYSFDIPEDGLYSPALESYHLSDFGIANIERLKVQIDGKEEIWNMEKKSDYVYFQKTFFRKGKHIVTIRLATKNSLIGSEFASLNGFARTATGSFELKNVGGIEFLSIKNQGSAQEVKATFKVNNFDWMTPYVMQFKHISVQGEHPIIRVIQRNQGTNIKIQSEKVPLSADAINPNTYSFYFVPVNTPSEITVELVAKLADDPYGTKVEFADLSLTKIFTNRMKLIKDSNPGNIGTTSVSFSRISPVLYSVSVENAKEPHIIVFQENYSPYWEIKLTDIDGRQLPNRAIHFSVNGYANAWYLEGTPEKYKMTISFKQQFLLIIGGAVSIATLAGCVVIFLVRGILNAKK